MFRLIVTQCKSLSPAHFSLKIHAITFTLFTSLLFVTSAHAAGGFIKQMPMQFDSLINLNPKQLCDLSKNTLGYLNDSTIEDPIAKNVGHVFKNSPDISLERVKETLIFICQLAKQVKFTDENPFANPNYLTRHFDFYRWYPDLTTAQDYAKQSKNPKKSNILNAIPSDQILLTKYYTKLLDGSHTKQGKYQHALYEVPYDETGLSENQLNKTANLTRYKYTRQHILQGALEHNKLAKPLVWLTEAAVHDVLLQGTGIININGNLRYFNVHRNNGIAYDYTKGKTNQARYWYFSEVPGIMGYGKEQNIKIEITPHHTFAGNIPDLGLGKLFLLSYQKENKRVAQLGVLADAGGAFHNNRFQLDLLVESYKGWVDYHQANKHLPDFVNAWMLLVKD